MLYLNFYHFMNFSYYGGVSGDMMFFTAHSVKSNSQAAVPLMRARSAGSIAATGSETLDGRLMPVLLTARTRKT